MGSIAYLWVGLGGALGAMARFGLAQVISGIPTTGWPWGTLLSNTLGCFCIGVFAFPLAGSSPSRWLIIVGFLGAFTTYSSFALETFNLSNQSIWQASLYAILTLMLSLFACGAGLVLGRLWVGA